MLGSVLLEEIAEVARATNMETAMIEIGKQIPAVVAIIYLMVRFLGSLEKRDEILNKIRQEWSDGMKSTVTSCSEVIDRNTEVMMQFHGAISQCAMMNKDKGK